MGVDAEIWFECHGAPPQLPDGFAACEVDRGLYDTPATHRVNTVERFYSPSYARGDWPALCGCLMTLIADQDVKRVWYFGDHSGIEGQTPLSVDDVLGLSLFYMMNGTRPYHNRFAKNKSGDGR